MPAGVSNAAALDAADPRLATRELFELPSGVIYLDGSSLGPAPKAAFAALDRMARHEWAQGLIRTAATMPVGSPGARRSDLRNKP
jgi:kynureninase